MIFRLITTFFILLVFLSTTKAQQVDSLEIRNAQLIQFDSLHLVSVYTQIPSEWMNRAEFGFQCRIKNNSADTVKGFISKFSITQLEDVDGNAVNGFTYKDIDSSNLQTNLLSDSIVQVSFDSTRLVPIYCGKYELTYSVLSMDSSYVDSIHHTFLVSDSVMAQDYDKFNSTVSPFDFQDTGTAPKPTGYTGVNVMGSLFYYSNDFFDIIHSVGLKVSSDSNNIGVSISTVIYKVDPSKLDSNNVAEQEPYYFSDIYRIKASDTNNWIAPYIDTSGVPIPPSGYYVVGWEEIFAPAGKEFSVQNDTISSGEIKNTSFVQFYDPYTTKSGTGWVSVDANPAIRLNVIHPLGGHGGANPPYCIQQSVGIEELEKEDDDSENVTVFPNPASENLHIRIGQENVIQEIRLYDLLGKEQRRPFTQESALSYGLDLSGVKSGVYILRLQFKDGKVLSKKVIKQ